MTYRAGRWAAAILALAAAAAVILWALPPTPGGPVPAGPMVQLLTSNSAAVVWWGPDLQHGQGLLRVAGPRGAVEIPAERMGNRFKASVSGLVPGSRVRYEAICKDQDGRVSHAAAADLHIPPLSGDRFAFAVIGDSARGRPAQYRNSRAMASRPLDLVLHVGDIVDTVIEPREYQELFRRQFLAPFAALLTRVPFYPALGNHDTYDTRGEPCLERFVLPLNGPAGVGPGHCYWFDHLNARFAAVDTDLDETVLRDAVAPWLRQLFASSPAAWEFVFFHHPPYTGGQHEPDTRVQRALVPAMEAARVDMVFSGHSHLYERTVPMAGGRAAASGEHGVVYVVTGAGGMSLAHSATPKPYMARQDCRHHSFTVVKIDGRILRLTQVSDRNRILDSVTFMKPAPPAPAAAASEAEGGQEGRGK